MYKVVDFFFFFPQYRTAKYFKFVSAVLVTSNVYCCYFVYNYYLNLCCVLPPLYATVKDRRERKILMRFINFWWGWTLLSPR